MRVSIEAVRLELTPALKSYVLEKLEQLDKLLEKAEKNAQAELTVEVSRATKHHRKGLVFRTEANLKLGGEIIRAEASGQDVRAAVDLVKDELKREIAGFKGRISAKERRGARVAKKDIRLSEAARFHRKGRLWHEGE